MSYIIEAFKALDCLNEETFAISDDGINKLAQFEQSDDLSDAITVYDMDAETEDDLEDSYVGKVILDCCVCHSKIYKDKSEVSIDEEQGIANIDMECPYCYSQEGFKVIGEVAPMTAEESTSETSAEPETESINEDLKTFNALKQKLANDEFDDYVAYNSEYSGFIDALYNKAVARLRKEYKNLYIEPSVQRGRGMVFASYDDNGQTHYCHWSYEDECEIIEECILEADNEEEFITSMCSYIETKLEDEDVYDDEDDYDESLVDESKSIKEGLFGKKKNNKSSNTFKVIDSQHEFTVKGGFKSKDDAYNWIENNKEPKDHSLYKVVQESLAESVEKRDIFCTDCDTVTTQTYKGEFKDGNRTLGRYICDRCGSENEDEPLKESVDKILDKAIDKYFDGEVRDYKVNGDKVDVTFKDGSQKTFNKSIFDESLNEASTDRVQKLLSIIDNSFEVLEDAPINEDALEEAKQIRLSSIPGVTRDPSNDFTDDGNRFQAYLYKGTVPITYLRDKEDVYITIAFHHLEDINYDEYKEFPSYKNADEFNGVPVDTFNAEIFQKNLEDAYKDIVDFLGSVEDVDSAQLEDRITSINNACKEYEEKVKQYIQDNALKIMKLSDYQFRNLKNYVSSAGNRTADYIRNASSSSQRHFMSRDLESLKRQISNSWNFEYIEDILNSVQESITESPALSKVTGTLGAALDAHKEELANATTSEALVELLNKIRPEVKEGQQAYLDSVIERVKRLPAIKGMQFVYNLILKGDGMSTKLDAAKPRKKAANESLEEVEVKTGDTKVEVSSDEDGKITVSSEPREDEETSEDNAEVIKPLSDETKASVENDETDVDIDDMDTDAFDELGESYLKRVYENVSAYKTSKVSTQDNKFVVEGLITFDSGNQKATSFVFESANCTKDGRLKFIGENMQIAKGEKAFSLIGTADNKKFVTESFNYNYRAKNNIGKSTRLYGTIKRG